MPEETVNPTVSDSSPEQTSEAITPANDEPHSVPPPSTDEQENADAMNGASESPSIPEPPSNENEDLLGWEVCPGVYESTEDELPVFAHFQLGGVTFTKLHDGYWHEDKA